MLPLLDKVAATGLAEDALNKEGADAWYHVFELCWAQALALSREGRGGGEELGLKVAHVKEALRTYEGLMGFPKLRMCYEAVAHGFDQALLRNVGAANVPSAGPDECRSTLRALFQEWVRNNAAATTIEQLASIAQKPGESPLEYFARFEPLIRQVGIMDLPEHALWKRFLRGLGTEYGDEDYREAQCMDRAAFMAVWVKGRMERAERQHANMLYDRGLANLSAGTLVASLSRGEDALTSALRRLLLPSSSSAAAAATAPAGAAATTCKPFALDRPASSGYATDPDDTAAGLPTALQLQQRRPGWNCFCRLHEFNPSHTTGRCSKQQPPPSAPPPEPFGSPCASTRAAFVSEAPRQQPSSAPPSLPHPYMPTRPYHAPAPSYSSHYQPASFPPPNQAPQQQPAHYHPQQQPAFEQSAPAPIHGGFQGCGCETERSDCHPDRVTEHLQQPGHTWARRQRAERQQIQAHMQPQRQSPAPAPANAGSAPTSAATTVADATAAPRAAVEANPAWHGYLESYAVESGTFYQVEYGEGYLGSHVGGSSRLSSTATDVQGGVSISGADGLGWRPKLSGVGLGPGRTCGGVAPQRAGKDNSGGCVTSPFAAASIIREQPPLPLEPAHTPQWEAPSAPARCTDPPKPLRELQPGSGEEVVLSKPLVNEREQHTLPGALGSPVPTPESPTPESHASVDGSHTLPAPATSEPRVPIARICSEALAAVCRVPAAHDADGDSRGGARVISALPGAHVTECAVASRATFALGLEVETFGDTCEDTTDDTMHVPDCTAALCCPSTSAADACGTAPALGVPINACTEAIANAGTLMQSATTFTSAAAIDGDERAVPSAFPVSLASVHSASAAALEGDSSSAVGSAVGSAKRLLNGTAACGDNGSFTGAAVLMDARGSAAHNAASNANTAAIPVAPACGPCSGKEAGVLGFMSKSWGLVLVLQLLRLFLGWGPPNALSLATACVPCAALALSHFLFVFISLRSRVTSGTPVSRLAPELRWLRRRVWEPGGTLISVRFGRVCEPLMCPAA